MDKDLLHKIFVSLRGIKQELYAKSFQVNDIRENLPPHFENAHRKSQTWRENLWRDLQRLEVRGKLGSKTLYWSLYTQHKPRLNCELSPASFSLFILFFFLTGKN